MLQIEKDCTEGKNHWIPLKLDQKKAWGTSKQKRMFMLSHEWPKAQPYGGARFSCARFC